MRKYKKTTTIQEINSMSIDKAYRYLLSDLRFGYINLKDGSGYRHALNSSITDNNTTAKILRLSQ